MEKEDRGFAHGVATGVHAAGTMSLLTLLLCCSLVELTSLTLISRGHQTWK